VLCSLGCLRKVDPGLRKTRLYPDRALLCRQLPAIRAVVREDVEETWGSFPDGPFNTDPVFEPRLKRLSESPEYTIRGCSSEDGRPSVFVIFRCAAAIRCQRYRDNGADLPLSTTRITGRVTYEIPINFRIDIESGEVEIVQILDLAWRKSRDWPN
jgi:hypothetical protein